MHTASQEAIWLRHLLEEIHTAITGAKVTLSPTHIFCDNLGAVHTANNPTSSGRSKHLNIRHLKIREWQKEFKLLVKHINGTENVADVFTKPLTVNVFRQYCTALGIKMC